MFRIMAIACLFAMGSFLVIGAEWTSAASQKTEGGKGITVEDLGRGLKSAAQNVEKEIPKIGPAIGETFKKAMSKESDKQPAQSPAKEKK